MSSEAPHPLVRTARASALLTAVALVVGGAAAYAVAGTPGLWAALLGIGVPAVFFGITLTVALLTRRTAGGALGAIVLGSWLAKLIGLVVLLAVLRPLDFYNRPVLGGTLLGWTVVMLGLEVRMVKRTNQLYVEPHSARVEPL